MAIESETAVATAVLRHGPVSRSELGRRLGLSPASLTRLTRPLLDRGLIVELSGGPGRGVGRPTRPLDIAPGVGTVVGVKLTGDHWHAVETDVRAVVRARADGPIAERDPAAVLEDVAAAVEALASARPAHVGVSLGGGVRGTTVRRAHFLGWRDEPFGDRLAERLGAPVILENDVVALAEAERWFGAGMDLDGFALVTIGAGIGYALVAAGEVVRTVDADAGTAGHLPLLPGGPPCSEGHRGCAQAMLSDAAIGARASRRLGRPVDAAETLRLAGDGDADAGAVVDESAEALGALVALVANVGLQPTVVLAGEGAGLARVARGRVASAIAARRPRDAAPVELRVADDGFDGWARGAAAVAIQAALPTLPVSLPARG